MGDVGVDAGRRGRRHHDQPTGYAADGGSVVFGGDTGSTG
jgi:hypothetical protein